MEANKRYSKILIQCLINGAFFSFGCLASWLFHKNKLFSDIMPTIIGGFIGNIIGSITIYLMNRKKHDSTNHES